MVLKPRPFLKLWYTCSDWFMTQQRMLTSPYACISVHMQSLKIVKKTEMGVDCEYSYICLHICA